MKFKIRIETWYRDSTQEWVGEVQINVTNEIHQISRVTGETEESARNAAFAATGGYLMNVVWTIEERKKKTK